MKKKKKQDISKIKCKHGWRPWSIVCVHLLNGSSMEWMPLPQNGKGVDWLCPECLNNWEKITKEHKLDDIRPICIDCIEVIRRVFDPKYSERENKKGKQTDGNANT